MRDGRGAVARRGATKVGPRLVLVATASITATIISAMWWSLPQPNPSDLAQVWAGARAFLAGQNPYDAVGPGRSLNLQFPLMYPLPAVLLISLLAWLPLRLLDPLFVGLGTAALAWGLTRNSLKNPQLLALVSVPFFLCLQLSQWAPLLMGAALVSSLGILLACKPNIGLALFLWSPRRSTALAVAGLYVLSVLIRPSWVADWLRSTDAATYATPGVLLPGGALTLLALLRWRLPEARVLVALACIPHTVALYETLYLFLIAKTWPRAAVLWATSLIGYLGWQLTKPWPSTEANLAFGALSAVWSMYLPATAILLLAAKETGTESRP